MLTEARYYRTQLRLCLEHAFGEFVCICNLAKMYNYEHFGANHLLDEMCILVEMCFLECTFAFALW